MYQLAKFEDLSTYWQDYFKKNDAVIEENFWGNLALLKEAERNKDPYIKQLKAMGYCFTQGFESPAPFYQSIAWIFNEIQTLIQSKQLRSSEVIWPARVFEVEKANGEMVFECRIIGEDFQETAEEKELIAPNLFVTMLGQGFFPMGGAIREHTNQSLAEHDLAHFGGLIAAPSFMRLVRKGFQKVGEKMHSNALVHEALKHYDSVYSLRLYYMIEVFAYIPDSKKKHLQEVLDLDIEQSVDLLRIVDFLKNKAKEPVKLYAYLHTIYSNFYALVEPLGGESRDILNRARKFNRSNRLGIYFSKSSNTHSKFDGSSIYSMYLNGCAALENKRSSHPDFWTALTEIHAPFIAALIGTSQLTIEDWVMQAIEELPDEESKLYKYLCKSKIWNESQTIYRAYGSSDYTNIITKS